MLGDGSVLWAFSGAVLNDKSNAGPGVLARVTGDSARGCFGATVVPPTAAFAPSPLGSGYIISPLDVVRVGDAVWSYYQLFRLDSSAAFGVVSAGFGIAQYENTSSQFVPTANLLWPGEGPSFGASALVIGTDAYVWGCSQESNRTQACFGAHALSASIDDPNAYEYATGAGFYTSDASAALPILDGAAGVHVRPHSSGRWFATYAPALGGGLVVRSSLGPMGPFSQPHDLLTCDLGNGDFCVGGEQHPEIDPEANTIAVSYAPTSFNGTPPGDRYWPRLVFAPLPDALP